MTDDLLRIDPDAPGFFQILKGAKGLSEQRFEYCGEHDLPKPCLRCSLLCPCGCDKLRDGVSEEVWDALAVIELFVRQHAKRSER